MSAAWTVVIVALWLLVVAIAFLVVGTLRRMSLVLQRAEAALASSPTGAAVGGLPPGAPLPAFKSKDVNGRRFASEDLLGRPAVGLLVGAECSACDDLIGDLGPTEFRTLRRESLLRPILPVLRASRE